MTATAPTDVAALREEILTTRAALGQTVEALTAKADIRARAARTANEATERVGQLVSVQADRASAAVRRAGSSVRQRPAPWIGAGLAVAGATAALLVWARGRS